MGLEEPDSLTSDYTAKLLSSKQYGSAHPHPNKTKLNQKNKIEIPEINPHTYGQLIYDKVGKHI